MAWSLILGWGLGSAAASLSSGFQHRPHRCMCTKKPKASQPANHDSRFSESLSKEQRGGDGEVLTAQEHWLVLPEDTSSVPRTHITGSEPSVTAAPGDPISSSGLCGHLYSHGHSLDMHTYREFFKKPFKISKKSQGREQQRRKRLVYTQVCIHTHHTHNTFSHFKT